MVFRVIDFRVIGFWWHVGEIWRWPYDTSMKLGSSLWGRVSSFFLREKKVGSDSMGNLYYTRLEKTVDGAWVEKRFVKVKGDYFDSKLPPEWFVWLSKGSKVPPNRNEEATNIKSEVNSKQEQSPPGEADEMQAWKRKQQQRAKGPNTEARTPRIQIHRE